MTRISRIQERYKETWWSAIRIPSILLILGKLQCEDAWVRPREGNLPPQPVTPKRSRRSTPLTTDLYKRNRTTFSFHNFMFQCLTLFYLFSFLFVEFTRTFPIYSHRAVNEPAWTVFTSNMLHSYSCYLILGAITRMHVTHGWPASYFIKLY